jgi:hypothetical protein
MSIEALLDALPPERQVEAKTWLAEFARVTGAAAELTEGGMIAFGAPAANGQRLGFSPRRREVVVYLRAPADSHAQHLALLGPHKADGHRLYVKRVADLNAAAFAALLSDDWVG